MLVKYTASGIGAVAGSALAPWRARQMAKARTIEAAGEARALELIAQAQAQALLPFRSEADDLRGVVNIETEGMAQRIEFQESKRQANIVSVVRGAAEELGDEEVPQHEPDSDWPARFFTDVQDISSDELQKIWSKILAGEVRQPGSTSLRTLSLLKNMSKTDAEVFRVLCRYVINDVLHQKCYLALEDVPDLSAFVQMQELGLMHVGLDLVRVLNLNDDGELTAGYCNHLLYLNGEKNRGIKIHGPVLTGPGKELNRFCDNEPDFKYLSQFAKHLAEDKCTLKIAPIIATDSQGDPVCKSTDLKVVKPAP